MRRWFRVIDCTRHWGMPIKLACIVLSIVAAAFNAYPLWFLPTPANYILMCTAGGVAFVGILAVILGLRILTILYILFETLMVIPVCVVIYFTTYTLASYDDCYYNNYQGAWYCYDSSDYQIWLFSLDSGLVWSALIVAFLSCITSGAALGAFRKLRLFQAGVSAVGGTHVNNHCHATPVIVAQPQVYTVQPATTVVTTTTPVTYTTQQTTYMQQQPQQPQMYPNLQAPSTYGQPGTTTVTYQGQAAPQNNYDIPPYNPQYTA